MVAELEWKAPMKTFALTAALAAAMLPGPALADSLPVSVPEKVGLSSEGLQRLTAALKAEVDAGQLPGAVVAVARRGQVAYFEAVGFRDAPAQAPMPPDAIFSIPPPPNPPLSLPLL